MEKIGYKQIIMIRRDLRNRSGQKVRTGKLIAQGAHASIAALAKMDISDESLEKKFTIQSILFLTEKERVWLRTGMKKICVGVDSEEELLSIIQQAKDADIQSYCVTDSGHTEFDKPTITCGVVGPAEDDLINTITNHLRLL